MTPDDAGDPGSGSGEKRRRRRPRAAEIEKLVRAAQHGSEPAFAMLYVLYHDYVYRYVARRLRDPHEAEDVTQEVFEDVRNGLSTYRAEAGKSWLAWLNKVMKNRVADHWRTKKDVDLLKPFELNLRRERELSGAEPGPESRLEWIDNDALLEAFRGLSAEQQEVLTLHLRFDLTLAETAEQLGRPASTVGTVHHRAIGTLRGRLSGSRRQTPADPTDKPRRGDLPYVRRSNGLSPAIWGRRYALAFNT